MLTPLPGATPTKPGSAVRRRPDRPLTAQTLPMFGVVPAVLDPTSGKELTGACSGYLALKQSWPGQVRVLRARGSPAAPHRIWRPCSL